MKRNIHKTIRINEELVQFIEDFPGESFNDKINRLLNFYVKQDSLYREELKRLEIEIENKKNQLIQFRIKISEFQNLLE